MCTSARGRIRRPKPCPTIITAAPMLGILGTVFGIITSFEILGDQTAATDPPPPYRGPDANYLRTDYTAEYIDRPTFTREDYDDRDEYAEEYSTLDTLYMTTEGFSALPDSPDVLLPLSHPGLDVPLGRVCQELSYTLLD